MKALNLFCHIWLGTLLMIVAPLGYGQEAKLKIDHLDKLAVKASEVSDVDLEGPLLQTASKFLSKGETDAEIKELVSGLKGIYVKSFEFEKAGVYSQSDLDIIRKQLQSPGWSRILSVHSKQDNESTEIYSMLNGDKIVGLAILSAEPKELTVVNIVGPVDLARMGGHFGIPPMSLNTGKSPSK